MANDNCLEGVKCPKCGQEDRFVITALVDVDVTDDGAEPVDSNFEWDAHSSVRCPECGRTGILRDFQAKGDQS